ncbi:hypothetical protein P4C99_12350 [Pontiellaceae bacterium B1224]|nr:hypothetical protein [Pontiellaceae bacterium B1224]
MKKLIALAVVLSSVAFVQAQDAEQKEKGGPRGPKGPITEEQFVAQGQARAEQEGIEFNEADAREKFAELDADGDGELSREEMPKRGERKGPKQGDEAPAE